MSLWAIAAAISTLTAAQASAASTSAASAYDPPAVLRAAFRPERLGGSTTVAFSLSIDPPPQSAPLPLSSIEVGYPLELGIATSGLGLEDCDPTVLEVQGASGCPANSKMGQGTALVELPFASEIVRERLTIDIFDAPSTNGSVLLEILASGSEPVLASIVFGAALQPGLLAIALPIIPSNPGAPDVSLVEMQATIGGPLTYLKHLRGGRTIEYRPRGVGLPDACPRGGWRFDARLGFVDGQRTQTQTTIPCPDHTRTPAAERRF